MILYFTGTGNSRYVADGLADLLGDETVCVNDYIKNNKVGEFNSDTPYVVVFPVYLSIIPKVLARFIRASSFAGCKKAYFIATCAGAAGSSPNAALSLCKYANLQYMGTEKIVMPQNYIALFKMTEAPEIEKRMNDATAKIAEMANVIRNNQYFSMKKANLFEYGVTKFVEWLYIKFFTRTGKFRATTECISCGLCKKLCPVNSIEIADGRPVWNKSCIHCMACINRCPKKAIEYGKNSVGKNRYVCAKYIRKNDM